MPAQSDPKRGAEGDYTGDMPKVEPNPYAPPRDGAATSVAAGEASCPWCKTNLRFLAVYLSLSSTITCPHCAHQSERRKRGLPNHVSESALMFLFLAIVVAIYWISSGKMVFASIAVLYPVFALADYLIDRRRLYLAKPDGPQFD